VGWRLSILFPLVGALSTQSVGCSTASCNSCIEAASATLALSCGPTNLTQVLVTGPCAGDGGTSRYVYGNEQQYVFVGSRTSGTCHVELVFATGFTYATDIQFSETTEGTCGGCAAYPGPSPSFVTVNNPPSTCEVDAGAEAASPTDATVGGEE
jgi:hypothetical protein